MTSWRQFAEQAPELAAAIEERFRVRKHCTMATLRRDGSPRVSGTEVEFCDGQVVLGSMPGALKARDLLRDPRVAVHSPTVDPPDAHPSAWEGEAKLAGIAVEVSGPGSDAHRFHVDVREVVLTKVAADGEALEITSWHEGRGVQVRRRA